MGTSAGDGTVTTAGPADGPAVLLLHSWWGRTPAIQEWAEWLVSAGRRVVLPDLFGGKTTGSPQEAGALAQAVIGDEDTYRLLERCADGLAADGRPWTAIGFSLGGFLACHLAGRGEAGPDELILFYGGQPPAGRISRTRRAVLHVVPDDEYFTSEEIAGTESAFRLAGAQVETYRYDGSGHWFAERGSPGFDETAFGLARSRVLAQLAR